MIRHRRKLLLVRFIVDNRQVSFSIKSVSDGDGYGEGIFTAYASVFGNVDSYGDVVAKGAFTDSLEEWSKSGNNIPLLFGHNMSDPDYNIGHIISATEDNHGLLVKGQIDLESPKGKQVYRLLKGRRVSQMSFAYDVIDGSFVKELDAYELRRLKLHEVSIVTVGANQSTQILDVKARASSIVNNVKSGSVTLSADNVEALRNLYEIIGSVVNTDSDDDIIESDRPSDINDDKAADSVDDAGSVAEPVDGPPAGETVDEKSTREIDTIDSVLKIIDSYEMEI